MSQHSLLTGLPAVGGDDEPAAWRTILTNGLLIGTANMLSYMVVVVNSAVCGHGGDGGATQVAMLGGYGLAQAMQNALHIAPAMAISSVLDTLVSQATGRRQFDRCVSSLGENRALVTLHWLLIVPFGLATDKVFIACGIDVASARFAGEFNRINVLSWWFRSQTYVARKFLVNMNSPGSNTVISLGVLLLHVAMIASFDFRVPLQTLAWITVCTSAVQAIALNAYLFYSAHSLKLDLKQLLRQPFKLPGSEMLRLMIPNVVQNCCELWSFEIFTVLAGWIGAASLAACSVAYNMTTLGYLVGSGIASAATGPVGEAIGCGRPLKARRTSLRFAMVTVALWFPKAALSFFGAQQISAMFSPQASVQGLLAPLLKLYSFTLLFDDTNLLWSAVLRAMGRPEPVAWAYFVFYYPVLLPLVYVLAFSAGLGVFGMYVGYTAASVGITLSLALVLAKSSFDAAASTANN